ASRRRDDAQVWPPGARVFARPRRAGRLLARRRGAAEALAAGARGLGRARAGAVLPARARRRPRRRDRGDRVGLASARAPAVRLVPVRVAVRDAQGRGAPPARPARRGAFGGLRAPGRLAVQRPVARLRAGVRRRRLVRAAAGGRALGRLPAVLRPVPLSADAAGVPRRRAPAAAARKPRGNRAVAGTRLAAALPPR